jgi:hypothetical protein
MAYTAAATLHLSPLASSPQHASRAPPCPASALTQYVPATRTFSNALIQHNQNAIDG